MKHLYTLCTACLLLICLLWNQQGIAQAPTHTARTVTINSVCGGYYEYLPQGYNPAGGQRYPLIVYLHGMGDIGSGSQGDLQLLLSKALPKYIHDGVFPTSFTVGSQTYSFLVISPQFTKKAWPQEVADVIQYAKDHYKVDTNRIYLTGMSMGGGEVFEFAGSDVAVAKKLAAIVPICGNSTPQTTRARVIANGNVPVWATHNQGDLAVPVAYTNDYVSYINTSPTPPHPAAQKTIFTVTPADNHDAWTQTYNPAFKENGKNIYEWMLQFTRAEASLPVELSQYKITSASKEAVTIAWTTASEQQNKYFSVERSADGVKFTKIGQEPATNQPNGSTYSFRDEQPATGNNYYRLSQTDLDGQTTYFSILKATVNVPAGSLVLFPNPATVSLTVGYQSPERERITIKFINQQGVVVQVHQYNKEAGYWQQSVPTGQLSTGQYFVKVSGTAFESTQPVVIRK